MLHTTFFSHGGGLVDVIFSGLFNSGDRASMNAMHTLGLICRDRYRETIAEIGDLSAEIAEFRNPAFWERVLVQAREVAPELAGVPVSVDPLFMSFADETLVNASSHFKRTDLDDKLQAAANFAVLIALIETEERKAVVEVLRKSAEHHRQAAERHRAKVAVIPGLLVTADPIDMDADFCELFARALSHDKQDD